MIFRFASPWLLLLLLVPLALMIYGYYSRKKTRVGTLQYSDLRLTTSFTPSLRQRLRFILPVLRMAALILLILAVARPQSGSAREIISGEGVDIAIVLDISGSMAALDFDPNRLGAAKRVIHDFVDNRQYDRIGFVIFATEAFSQVPPTLDYQVLKRILDETQVSWDIGLDSGTAIGLGLANGANMLRDSEAESRVIILLTDGANNSGQIDPLTAAEIAKALDIRVYTIGAARPGPAALPFPDGRIEYRDSEIDEETLKEIAEITGGLYFRAEDDVGLQEIYDTINELERSQVEVRTFTRYSELALWFIVPAALLLVLEILLRRTWLRRLP
ncbi:MAG TPA: VWA domain-containing protein [Anaerolineae bacterium]|nr:VWA domain-containing protein [Anaerolineae bacterium]HMR63474.1 VWA domain-containing protein [Anaerolineae bacterium]